MQCLEQHIGQAPQPIVKNLAVTREIEIDPRLQQPVQLSTKQITISPSKTKSALQDSSLTTIHNEESELDARKRGILIHKMIEMLSTQPELSFTVFCQSNRLNQQAKSMTDYWQQAQQTILSFPD